MPPIRSQTSRNPAEQEGRILLAIKAYKNKEISSIREIARRFNIPRSTLRDRLSGLTERSITCANSHKLTEIEEEILRKWILSLDDRGAAPRPTTVRETANILLAARQTTPVQTVGEKWASSIKTLLRIDSRSPLSPSERALNQLIKGCQLALQGAAILAKENSELRAANEKQKQKRTRWNRQIAHEGDLSVQEVRELRAELIEAQVACISRAREQISGPLQPRTRALPKCGACGNQGHRRNACPNSAAV